MIINKNIAIAALITTLSITTYAMAEDETSANADYLGSVASSGETTDTDLLASQIKQMRGELEKMQHEIASLKEQLGKFTADTEMRFKDAGSIKKDAPEDTSTSDTATTADPDELYRSSYSLLKEKKYALAAKSFRTFLKQFPEHALVSSAYYWLGELKMAEKQYDQAAVEYMKGYKKNPKGNRAPDNLLKLGTALGKINKRREACISLFKLQKEFPTLSPNIKKSLDSQLKLLSCES